MYIAARHRKHIMSWPQTSSKNYITKGSSLKKHPNNTTTRRHISFLPTVISQANVLTVTPKVLMAINARSVVLLFLQQILSTPRVLSVAANRWWKKPNTGISHWTNTKHGCVNGFWKITKNGAPMYTANVKAGSTWACSLVQWAVTWTGEFPFR